MFSLKGSGSVELGLSHAIEGQDVVSKFLMYYSPYFFDSILQCLHLNAVMCLLFTM